MIKIDKIKRIVQKETKGKSLTNIHNELASLTEKFIGISYNEDTKEAIIHVEDTITQTEIDNLKAKLKTLLGV